MVRKRPVTFCFPEQALLSAWLQPGAQLECQRASCSPLLEESAPGPSSLEALRQLLSAQSSLPHQVICHRLYGWFSCKLFLSIGRSLYKYSTGGVSEPLLPPGFNLLKDQISSNKRSDRLKSTVGYRDCAGRPLPSPLPSQPRGYR